MKVNFNATVDATVTSTLSDADRELLTNYLVLEWMGQNDDGEDVWKVYGLTQDRAEAESKCINEYFAVGPLVLGEWPSGTWDALYFPRRRQAGMSARPGGAA
jgi:hypothetical protein